MYRIISTLSFFIREYYFPNPFGNMFNPGIAELVNILAGGILIKLAFWLTGTWHTRSKENAWKGSLGFFINYSILGVILLVLGKYFSNVYWIVILFSIIYIILCLVESKLFSNKNIIEL